MSSVRRAVDEGDIQSDLAMSCLVQGQCCARLSLRFAEARLEVYPGVRMRKRVEVVI